MSDKYQREIEEILREAGDREPADAPAGEKPRFWVLARSYIAQSLGGKRWSLSPGRVMLVAVSLLIAALVLRSAVPGVGIVGPLAWAGLLLFIVGYGLFFVKPPKIEKKWRGQSLEDGSAESLWTRLRRRIK